VYRNNGRGRYPSRDKQAGRNTWGNYTLNLAVMTFAKLAFPVAGTGPAALLPAMHAVILAGQALS
jgi:hypothetical protein